ncbi:MAG TPA: hypothetical protein VIJ06_03785 [Methylovirgula sp.]
MTGLDLNARMQTRTVGADSDFETSLPENISVRQTRLAEAMCEIFFRQIKLVNAVTIELPLGWLRGAAEPALASHEAVAEPQPVVSALLSPPPSRPFPPMANLDPVDHVGAPMPHHEAPQFAEAKARRKNKANRKHPVS